MNDSKHHDAESADTRVRYAARYENEGQAADRTDAVAARAARAMRDGDRSMDGSPRDHQPGGGRSGPDWMPHGFPAQHDPCRCGLPACRSGWPGPWEIAKVQEAREAGAERFADRASRASRQPELEAG